MLDLSFLQRDNAHNIRKIPESIVNDLSGVYSFEFEEDVLDTAFQDRKDAVHKEFSELLKDGNLPKNIISEIKHAIYSLQKNRSL